MFCWIWPFWPFPHCGSTLSSGLLPNLSSLFLFYLYYCSFYVSFMAFILCPPHTAHTFLNRFTLFQGLNAQIPITSKCIWSNVCRLNFRPGFLIACGYLAPPSLSTCPKLILLPSIPLLLYSYSLFLLSPLHLLSVFANCPEALSSYPS